MGAHRGVDAVLEQTTVLTLLHDCIMLLQVTYNNCNNHDKTIDI